MSDPLQFGLGAGYGFGGRLPYLVAFLLVGIGLAVVVDDDDLVKKVLGLGVFQTGIFLFVVASAVRVGGRAPLLSAPGPYVNPLPQVLILTAIVVGVSVTGVALALVVRLHETYGTLDVEAIREEERD
jgi:multicomponent Na+:H+ antiporter subunit C